MKKTAIITDSNSGITLEEAKELGIYLVEIPIIIGGKEYFESTIEPSVFEAKIEHKEAVLTAQPALAKIILLWESLLKAGYEEIVHIPMSSALSGICDNLKNSARNYPGQVEVVDNRLISVLQKTSVLQALKLVEKGYGAKEIKTILERDAASSIIYLGVESLDYLLKGGRASQILKTLANIIVIKPLLVINGGKIDLYRQFKTNKKLRKELLKELNKKLVELEEKGEEVILMAASSYFNEKEKKAWLKEVKSNFKNREIVYGQLSYNITAHLGPNAFGLGVSIVNQEIRENYE